MLFKYFNSSWYLPLCIYVNNISVEFYWFNNILDPDLSIIDLVFSTTSTYPVSNSKNVVSLVEMRTLPFTFWNNWQKYITYGNQKWPKLNALEPKMAKIPHNKIKQPSFGEKRPKSTYAKIFRFTVVYSWSFVSSFGVICLFNSHVTLTCFGVMKRHLDVKVYLR